MSENMAESVEGIRLESHQVIRRPLITEKTVHKAERLGQYSFEIHPMATKADVRRAVEELYHVPVSHVCTQTRQGKQRRYRFKQGSTKSWRKAIVSLGGDHRINFY